jgi:putative acetyltransferase
LRENNELLGIGALKYVEPFNVEIKSMHTTRMARNRGVARAILEHLLAFARSRELRVSLQTGSMAAFAPARALYRSMGFRQCAPFGEHCRSQDTICMSLIQSSAFESTVLQEQRRNRT